MMRKLCGRFGVKPAFSNATTVSPLKIPGGDSLPPSQRVTLKFLWEEGRQPVSGLS